MLPPYISRYVEVYDIAVIAMYRDIIDFYISRYISRQHWVWRRYSSNNTTFQVASLTSKGLSAVCAVGDTRQDKMEVDLIRNDITRASHQILFISPELLLDSLVNLTWRDMIRFDVMCIRCNYSRIQKTGRAGAVTGRTTARLSATLSEPDSSCTQQRTSSYHRPLALPLDMLF